MVRRQIKMPWIVFTNVTRNRKIGNAGRHDVFPLKKYTFFCFHWLAFIFARIGMGGIPSEKWIILTLAHLPALFLTAVQREDNLRSSDFSLQREWKWLIHISQMLILVWSAMFQFVRKGFIQMDRDKVI